MLSPAAKPLHKKPPTPAQLAHRQKLKEYGRKGGNAPKSPREAKPVDEAQAFERQKDKWQELADKLVREALKAARDPKKDGRSLVAITTSAGIAHDKRWAKQVSDTAEIEFPPSLAAQIGAKLAKPLNSKDSECMIQDKSCSEPEQPDDPLDPMLLSPGL